MQNENDAQENSHLRFLSWHNEPAVCRLFCAEIARYTHASRTPYENPAGRKKFLCWS
jgi:hypothetical protein